MLRLAPTRWANPGNMGITVLWLASAKKIAKLMSAISLVIPGRVVFIQSPIGFKLLKSMLSRRDLDDFVSGSFINKHDVCV